MSLGDLIKQLNKYPSEIHVVFLDNDGLWSGEPHLEVAPMQIWDDCVLVGVPTLRIRGKIDRER